MPIRIATLIVAVFLLLRVYRRYRRGQLSWRLALLWSVPWAGIGVVMIFPELADAVADRVGIVTATGIDFLAYVAVGALVYGIYRVSLRLDRIEREITRLVREIALREASKD